MFFQEFTTEFTTEVTEVHRGGHVGNTNESRKFSYFCTAFTTKDLPAKELSLLEFFSRIHH
jgi:hypothetical protein